MGYIDELWARVNDVTAVVSNVVNYATSFVTTVTTPQGSAFGGGGGFGGGGAGGTVETPLGTGSSGGGAVSTAPSIDLKIASVDVGKIVTQDVPQMVSQIGKVTMSAAEYTGEVFKGYVESLRSSIVNSLSQSLQNIWTGITSIKDTVVSAITSAWEKANLVFSATLGGAVRVISQGIDDAVEAVRRVYFTIDQYLTGQIAGLSQGFEILRSTVEGELKLTNASLSKVVGSLSIFASPEEFAPFLVDALTIALTKEM